MMYKMIALDMDGTLLNDEKKVSNRNKRAIEKADDFGVKIVVSTGRLFTSASFFGEMIGVKSPIISSNGAYIREKDRDEVIYERLLGSENAYKIVNLCKKHDLYCHLFTSDTVFTEKIIYASFNYANYNLDMPDDKKININVIKPNDWEAIIEKYKDKILKAVIADEDSDKIIALRKDVCDLDVEVVSSFSNNIEIMSKGTSKGDAVRVLADFYGINKDEVICIGDGENDISMIKYAGLGIAMGNAIDEVKDAADFVTLSNEDDGVAHAIEKFVLQI